MDDAVRRPKMYGQCTTCGGMYGYAPRVEGAYSYAWS